MKYTKKVPYFKKGDKVKKRVEVGNTGKTKEEIMAEARRNAAPAREDRERAEREQRAYDNIPEAQKEAIRRVHAGNAAAEREAKIGGIGAGFQKPQPEEVIYNPPRMPMPRIQRPSVGGVTPIQGSRPNVPRQRPAPGNPNVGTAPTAPWIPRPSLGEPEVSVNPNLAGPDYQNMPINVTTSNVSEKPNWWERIKSRNNQYLEDQEVRLQKHYQENALKRENKVNEKRENNRARWEKIRKRNPEIFKIGGTVEKYQQGSRGYQQGGQVEQPQMTEEDLIIDFTVRYLSALGVAPEDIIDQQGSLNPAYVEEMTNVLKQDINWDSYLESPDEYIQQFVGSRMQMARKGAKLKRLSKLRIYKK